MPFENERDDILFPIRMGLMHCRISPKAEHREHVRRAQAECVLENLERSGYRIMRTMRSARWSRQILASEDADRVKDTTATRGAYQLRSSHGLYTRAHLSRSGPLLYVLSSF